jgi:branched-chain amino acid transport system ATP-binding protein
MGEPILSVQGISMRFGGLVAVDDVSFDVYPGEVVGLMGPNGAGKTTLLSIIGGEYVPYAGKIIFKGNEITRCPPHQTCYQGISRTYQIPQPFVNLSVRENLMVSQVFGRRTRKADARFTSDNLFDLVDLSGKKDALAGSLPVLSLKKLEVARALASAPELILLDEVAAGSTELEIPRMLETLEKIREMGVTVVIVEHVMKVLVNAVDRIVVIDKGMKIAEGKPDVVMNDNKVIEAYFGA